MSGSVRQMSAGAPLDRLFNSPATSFCIAYHSCWNTCIFQEQGQRWGSQLHPAELIRNGR